MSSRLHTWRLLILFLLLWTLAAYEQLNNKRAYMAFLEQQSTYPSFQVFYNRHFRKSRQFEEFVEVIQDVEAKVKEYAKIIFTDCDEALGEGFTQCQQIMDNNQNRYTVGLKPNSNFLSLSGKLLQRNPSQVKYNHPLDIYTVTQLVEFIDGLVPSYLIDVVSNEQYQGFLQPKYSTKALYFTKEEEVPLNIKKLATIYHMKIDFARVEDLSEDIIQKHKIIHFPTLLVLKYNYTTSKFDSFRYSGPHFDTQGYLKMKIFLKSYAAVQPRNDLLFHSIRMQTNNSIITVESHQHKEQKLDRMSGMVWIQQSPEVKYLSQLMSKYSDFFNYIHISNPNISDTKIFLYNTEHHRTQQESKNQFPHLEFVGLDSKSLMSNITFFMQRNYSVMVVPKQYGYFCTIIHKRFFQGITNCFIGNSEAITELKKQTGEFEYGAVTYQTPDTSNKRFTGSLIKGSDYQTVYKTLEEGVKVKLDLEIRQFLQNPTTQITEKTSIFSVCADPRRKCVISFLDKSKAIAFKTQQGYLKDIAQQYYSDFRFYWVDINCNKDLLDSLDESKSTVLLIDPIKQKSQSLKQRITKSILIKFLKAVKVNTKKEKNIYMGTVLNQCLTSNQTQL